MIISKGKSSSILTAGNQIYQVYRYLLGWPRCSTSNPFTRGRHKPINNCEKKKSLLGLKVTKQYALDARRLDWPFSVRASLEKKVKFHPCPLSTANPFLTFEFLTFLLPEALLSPTLFPIADKWVEMACLQPFFYNCLSKEKVARCSTRAK